MTISLDKIAPPVAFVVVGLILIIIGATGVIPFGNPQPTISEPLLKALLVILGTVLLILGPLFVWRELRAGKSTSLSDINKNTLSKSTTEEAGELTGKWEQIIYDIKSPKKIVKRDLVECKHFGEKVEAEITRLVPEVQKGRKWHFSGRFRQGILFGHFWSERQDHFSFGTIYLRQEKTVLKGNYVRAWKYSTSWSSDKLTVQIIRLQWQRSTQIQ